ncbi:MAG: DegT/DnrJ/EryC1/StrS family aminotransferase [Bacteroidales bacterium]|jgi:dTDP-4-amino-4,6-dideoxygalactose transaminase|nr:DegT/DnrJ/EryC1/StrS family aminotransferase [Bacteroidales bacterium]
MIKNIDLQAVTNLHLDEYKQAVCRVIESGWYLQGHENAEFEKKYAQFIGTEHCVGVANGLDALKLIMRAYIELGIMHYGDEIIVPANTYIATILAISENNLVPILVEPDINTYQIDPEKIEGFITNRTKGIMIVHLYGQCAYTEKIASICKKYKLKLMEDNAQAHGCKYRGKMTGSLGDAAAHSFYPTKNMGAFGDAGAITTNDKKVADLIRTLANYGSEKKYIFDYQGLNSRLDEIQAAVLNIKLKYIDEDNNHRKNVARYYIDHIKHPEIIMPKVMDWDTHVFHIFTVRTKKRNELQGYLYENDVHTVVHYPIPPHKQRCYKEYNYKSFPITELIHNQELSLPMSPVIALDEVEKVVELINEWRA